MPTKADLATVPAGFAGVALGDELEINFRIVCGVTRTWQGGAAAKGKNATPGSATDWAYAANWSPEGVPFRLERTTSPSTLVHQPPAPATSQPLARTHRRGTTGYRLARLERASGQRKQ